MLCLFFIALPSALCVGMQDAPTQEPAPASRPVPKRIRVELTLDLDYIPWSFTTLGLTDVETNLLLAGAPVPFAYYEATVGSDVELRALALGEPAGGLEVTLDCDRDGEFGDEESRMLAPGEQLQVEVTGRKGAGVSGSLPYTLFYTEPRSVNETPTLAWAESYIARGEVALGDARYPISMRDATADGVFEAADLDRGTMLGVGSGADTKEKFYGKGQLIPLGDRRFVFDAVEPDGSALTLVESHLPIPTIGERFPAFQIRLANGSQLDLARRRGQPLIIDLWSSW
jgi:hypothetical protein